LLWIKNKLCGGKGMERKTPPFIDGNGDVVKESISLIKQIKLGGIEQGILIRGENIYNPVLMILHGGPGAPHIGHARHFQKELEKHFVVVNWDQRGSGMSYDENISINSMNLEQFILDALELVEYLREKFSNNKIVLVGYSWGSIIGMNIIQRYPEYFCAYFGVSQFVNMHENSIQVYKLLQDKAITKNNKKAIEQLAKLDIGNIEGSMVDLQNISFESGMMHTDLQLAEHLRDLCKNSGEYIEQDLMILNSCYEFSRKALLNDLNAVDLYHTILKVEVPVCFLVGRNDATLSPYLSEQYLEKIDAPKKKIIWFEHSAHDIIFSENELFQATIINNACSDM
jgi:pimeloyl-ACP methyl ester carboxylesterase